MDFIKSIFIKYIPKIFKYTAVAWSGHEIGDAISNSGNAVPEARAVVPYESVNSRAIDTSAKAEDVEDLKMWMLISFGALLIGAFIIISAQVYISHAKNAVKKFKRSLEQA